MLAQMPDIAPYFINCFKTKVQSSEVVYITLLTLVLLLSCFLSWDNLKP